MGIMNANINEELDEVFDTIDKEFDTTEVPSIEDVMNADIDDIVDNASFINEVNATIDSMKKEDEERVNEIFNLSDEIIDSSLGFEELKKAKKKAGRSRKEAAQAALDFYYDHSEKNYQRVMDGFWWGILKAAYDIVKDNDVAKDMAIITFERVWNHIDTYNPEKAKFSTWIWTICRNNCIQWNKQKAKENKVNCDISDLYDSAIMSSSMKSFTQEHLVTSTEGDITSMSHKEITTTLYDVSINEIMNLDGKIGQILSMKLIDNMKIREIAQNLNMNVSTVKNYLYKGKDMIYNRLLSNHKELCEQYFESCNEDSKNEY